MRFQTKTAYQLAEHERMRAWRCGAVARAVRWQAATQDLERVAQLQALRASERAKRGPGWQGVADYYSREIDRIVRGGV